MGRWKGWNSPTAAYWLHLYRLQTPNTSQCGIQLCLQVVQNCSHVWSRGKKLGTAEEREEARQWTKNQTDLPKLLFGRGGRQQSQMQHIRCWEGRELVQSASGGCCCKIGNSIHQISHTLNTNWAHPSTPTVRIWPSFAYHCELPPFPRFTPHPCFAHFHTPRGFANEERNWSVRSTDGDHPCKSAT